MNSNFNIVERKLAVILSRFPKSKILLKRTYQYLNYLLYKEKYTFRTPYQPKEWEYKNYETFFGYYDKSPINKTNEYILYHATAISTKRSPDPKIPIHIVVADAKNKVVLKTLKTKSYNWQQGARTQWIDSERFIFNDYDVERKKYVSKIIRLSGLEVEKIINFPVYDVREDIALSLNFERLAKLRPDYGYKNSDWKKVDLNDITNDGIFIINLRKNQTKLLIPLERVIETGKMVDKPSLHKVNHIMISPNGDKFIFLHRYFIKNRKYDRLLMSDIQGQEIRVLADNEMVSHYSWVDNDIIVCYMRDFDYGDRYYLIDTLNSRKRIVGKGMIDKFGDGHPSVFNNIILFDTYPDKSRMQKIFLYNIITSQVKELGRFYTALSYYGESRCDLHPRWSMDGKTIFFDSVHTGSRKLYQMEI